VTSDEKKPRSYRDLIVWQKGIALVKRIYELTARFPTEEKFGLMSQMRRAAVSVPSNVAEGQARKSTREFVQFISNSEGSLAELDTQIVLGQELNLINATESQKTALQIDELRRMLNSLRRRLMGARTQ
jgi:four helix bundle protein